MTIEELRAAMPLLKMAEVSRRYHRKKDPDYLGERARNGSPALEDADIEKLCEVMPELLPLARELTRYYGE